MVRSTCSRTAAAILRNVSREKATCRWQPTFQQRCLQTDARSQQTLARQVPLQSSRLSRPTQQSGRTPIAAQVSQSQRKTFSTTPSRQHGDLTPPKPGEERKVTFIDKDLQEHTFEVADGDNLLDIAQANDLEMEGACGGSCACSTCHVIVTEDEMFDKMEEPSDDENDMLDLAFGLTETSRLGCQVVMNKELDGLVVKLPSMTRNLQASDFADKKG